MPYENRAKFNKNIFSNPSEEMFYWVGFLMADGNVYSKGYKNKLSVHLCQKDEEHLLKLVRFFEYREPKKLTKNFNHNSIRFEVDCKQIIEALNFYGIVPNKSLIAEPKNIPDKYMQYFILGYFDGNGCLSYHELRNCWRMAIAGSDNISKFIHNYINSNSTESFCLRKDGLISKFYSSKIAAIKEFLDYIYQDNPSFCLTRKYNKYKEFNNWYNARSI